MSRNTPSATLRIAVNRPRMRAAMISSGVPCAAKPGGARHPKERDERDCRAGNCITPIICESGCDDAEEFFEFALPLESRNQQAEKAACARLRLEQPLQHGLPVLQLDELFRKLVNGQKVSVAVIGAKL